MNKILKYILKGSCVLSLIGFGMTMWSCSDEPGDSPFIKSPAKSTVLVYAIATNSLSGNLVSDKNEMLKAAQEINLNDNNVLVFETKYKRLSDGTTVSDKNLLKLVPNSKGYDWEIVKSFNDDVDPLNPSRISEVVNYVTDKFKSNSYGLVFWSHSTGSQPYTYATKASDPMAYSFGQDLTVSNDEFQQINVDDLANALPDHLFNYIWFDSCYMSNIETIYEFRNKCNTFVGYPTEVLEYGLPYDIVLPYMVGEKPDLGYAAELFYNYYANSIATIAVVDMKQVENFAEDCSKIFKQDTDVNTSGFIKYTRYTTGPFYDLGDYAKAMAQQSDTELSDETWNEILDKVVVYKAATRRDFANNVIDPERYSGISAHVFNFDLDNTSENYYKNLSWFARVF